MFKVTTAGAYSLVRAFPQRTGGSTPRAPLIQAVQRPLVRHHLLRRRREYRHHLQHHACGCAGVAADLRLLGIPRRHVPGNGCDAGGGRQPVRRRRCSSAESAWAKAGARPLGRYRGSPRQGYRPTCTNSTTRGWGCACRSAAAGVPTETFTAPRPSTARTSDGTAFRMAPDGTLTVLHAFHFDRPVRAPTRAAGSFAGPMAISMAPPRARVSSAGCDSAMAPCSG